MKTGGGNRVFFELANCLAGQHEVEIVAPNNTDEDNGFCKNDSVAIRKIGRFAPSKARKLLNVLKVYSTLNRSYGNALIVFTDPIMCIFLFLIKNKSRVYRFIQADDYRLFDDGMILRSGISLRAYKCLCKTSYRYKVRYIFNSKFTWEQFCEISGRGDVSPDIVHPAVSHDLFRDNGSSKRTAELNIAIIARVHPLKGFDEFIRAVRSLPQSYRKRIDNVFVISHDDLSAFEIDDFVRLKPASDEELADIYNSARIFVSPSWREGFGLPGLEAMACGCCLITSDSGGPREYAVNGENALVFEPKSVDGLVSCLVKALDSPDTVKRLSDEARITARSFSWKSSATQMETILES
jgi:glycosyltransferase involved in cell wall biosynthesis